MLKKRIVYVSTNTDGNDAAEKTMTMKEAGASRVWESDDPNEELVLEVPEKAEGVTFLLGKRWHEATVGKFDRVRAAGAPFAFFEKKVTDVLRIAAAFVSAELEKAGYRACGGPAFPKGMTLGDVEKATPEAREMLAALQSRPTVVAATADLAAEAEKDAGRADGAAEGTDVPEAAAATETEGTAAPEAAPAAQANPEDAQASPEDAQASSEDAQEAASGADASEAETAAEKTDVAAAAEAEADASGAAETDGESYPELAGKEFRLVDKVRDVDARVAFTGTYRKPYSDSKKRTAQVKLLAGSKVYGAVTSGYRGPKAEAEAALRVVGDDLRTKEDVAFSCPTAAMLAVLGYQTTVARFVADDGTTMYENLEKFRASLAASEASAKKAKADEKAEAAKTPDAIPEKVEFERLKGPGNVEYRLSENGRYSFVAKDGGKVGPDGTVEGAFQQSVGGRFETFGVALRPIPGKEGEYFVSPLPDDGRRFVTYGPTGRFMVERKKTVKATTGIKNYEGCTGRFSLTGYRLIAKAVRSKKDAAA